MLRRVAHIGPSKGGASCGIYVPGKSHPGACGRVSVARAPHSLWKDSQRAILHVGARAAHVDELQRRVELKGGRVETLLRELRTRSRHRRRDLPEHSPTINSILLSTLYR